MSITEIGFVDQLHVQLYHLLNNTQTHFTKRRKLLLQYERKNNQLRRMDSIDRKKITENYDLIRRIKKQIIEDDRRLIQQRRDQHEQHRKLSSNQMTGAIGAIILAAISIATLIMMIIIMLEKSKENIF